ncbi:unnamed protein product [Arabis nemorensis]|uniref:Uncharacterized protein n=1 Tax=Arabis nemorensis TaxID=586526 RepID=A0A565AW32_9BRAS|nr:unnamed protein product [Arabis nemorensis]
MALESDALCKMFSVYNFLNGTQYELLSCHAEAQEHLVIAVPHVKTSTEMAKIVRTLFFGEIYGEDVRRNGWIVGTMKSSP